MVLLLVVVAGIVFWAINRRDRSHGMSSAYKTLHARSAPVDVPLYGADEERSVGRYSDPYTDKEWCAYYCNLLNILLLRHDVSSTFRIANNYSYSGSSSYLHTVTVLAPNGWEIILPNDCRKVRLAHLSDTHLCLDPLTPWGPLNIVRGHHHLRGALQHIATFKIAKLQSSNPAFLPY